MIAGISVATLFLIVLGLKNKESLVELYATLAKRIKKTPCKVNVQEIAADISANVEIPISTRTYTLPETSFDVSQHIRTLAEGQQHSAEKEAEAARLGIVLLPNQTIVDTYTKYATA